MQSLSLVLRQNQSKYNNCSDDMHSNLYGMRMCVKYALYMRLYGGEGARGHNGLIAWLAIFLAQIPPDTPISIV